MKIGMNAKTMIKQKKKICKDCGRSTYLFAGKRCKQCHFKQRYGQLQPLSRKSGYKIPPVSKRRSTELKTYSKLIQEIEEEARVNKDLSCFFCGEEIKGIADHHHLDGRDGEMLTKKEFIVRAHRECHSNYHNMPVDKLPWFPNFLTRLAIISPALAYKERLKFDK